MNVKLLTYTKDPEKTVAAAAKQYYSQERPQLVRQTVQGQDDAAPAIRCRALYIID